MAKHVARRPLALRLQERLPGEHEDLRTVWDACPVSEPFYSDRVSGPRPRDVENLPLVTWRGLVALVEQRIEGHWLAQAFPEQCSDGNGVCGTDRRNLFDLMEALVPDLGEWPLDRHSVPPEAVVYDLVDFIAQRVAEPRQESWHQFFRHYELGFDVTTGQAVFRRDVNQLLGRAGLAFEVGVDMRVVRLGPPEARASLADLRPDTGDEVLDGLIVDARVRFLSRAPGEERIGLEKLWDAFERLKTLEGGGDKKASVAALLDRAATGEMRARLDTEAMELTSIGNQMQIRHFETSKEPLSDDDVDYLFTRMSALLVQLLRRTGRLTS